MKKLAATLLIFFIIALAIPLNSVLGQTRAVGVSVGDTFRYTYHLDFNVDNSSDLTLPSYIDQLFEQARAIEWAQINITSITGTEVTAQTLLHYNNGTEQTSTQTTNVATGEDTMSMFLIASNLNQNDPIYTNQMSQTINETVTRNYPSGSRQLNHQSIMMNYNVTQDQMQGFNMSDFMQQNQEDIYWDRQLGVLVEMSYNMVTRSPVMNANITMTLNLTESNALTIPEFPTFIPALIVVCASAIAVAFIKIKSKKTESQIE